MLNKTLITLTAVTALAISSTARAKGAGGWLHGVPMHGHGHFHNHSHFVDHFHFRNHFLRNQALLNGWGGGWGLGGDWGWGGYGDNGNSNTTVVVFPQAKPQFPQAKPQAADVTGSIATDPCHWNTDTFEVPSSAGGTRPVQVVSCR
jgi:hypothetical protein